MAPSPQHLLAVLVAGFVLLAGTAALALPPRPGSALLSDDQIAERQPDRPELAGLPDLADVADRLAPARDRAAASPGEPERRPVRAVPDVPIRSARLSDAADPPGAPPPVTVRIPSLGVDAPVVPVGVEADGTMEIPADVRTVGWYRYGPAPGEPGSAVLSSHVDDRRRGRGVLFDLRTVRPGAEVEVVDAAGRSLRFVVRAREQLPKADLPLDVVFSSAGAPQLVLVTCGGEFDRAAGRYADNVVVVADLLVTKNR